MGNYRLFYLLSSGSMKFFVYIIHRMQFGLQKGVSLECEHTLKNDYKRKPFQKQLPLKKTLIFLFLDFLRGIATAVFMRKYNK